MDVRVYLEEVLGVLFKLFWVNLGIILDGLIYF